jgi:hypothetical protein
VTTLRTTRHSTRRRVASGLLPLLALGALVGVVAGFAGYLVQKAKNEQLALDRENAEALAEMRRPKFTAPIDASAPSSLPALPSAAPAASPLPVYVPAPVDAAAPAAARASAAASAPAYAGRAAAPAAPALAGSGDAAAQAAARSDGRLTSLLAAPASYLALRTHLGSADRLRGFLGNRARTERYAGHPVVKAVLSSPTLIRALLRPAVVRAFVGSPAMQDPRAVSALLDSPLARTITSAPGVKQAIRDDPRLVLTLTNDPPVDAWVRKNPRALNVLVGLTSGR